MTTWIRDLARHFHSEREVEVHIILAIAAHLGFDPSRHCATGYTIPGSRKQADVVLFAHEEHKPESALVVVEVKKPSNAEDPIPQARNYAEVLHVPYYAVCNGIYLEVYRRSDDHKQFEARSLDELEEKWDSLSRLIHRGILMSAFPDRSLPVDEEVRATRHEHTYRKAVQDRHQYVQVLHRHDALDIRSLYVPTRLSEVIDKPDNTSSKSGHRGRNHTWESKPQLADEVIRKYSRVVVVGDPGAGKTTMMRHLAVELAAGNITGAEELIPILVPLNDLFKKRRKDDDTDIHSFFLVHLGQELERMGIPGGDKWIRWWLNRGRVLLLWDGLDEVTGFRYEDHGNPYATEQAYELIATMAERYGGGFVATCRTGAWQARVRNLPPDALVFQTLPFQSEDISAFVQGWFLKEPEKAHVLMDALESSPQAYQLAGSPLLLTFMTYQFERFEVPPGRDRHRIFRQCTDLLMHEWDKDPSRSVARRPIVTEFSMRRLLGELALEMHSEGVRAMDKDRLTKHIGRYLDRLGVAIDRAKDVVEGDVQSKYGLIREFVPGEYRFLHHSLQEFLVAEAIDHRHWAQWGEPRVLEKAGDPWWNEVIIHLAGGEHGEQVVRVLALAQDDIFHTRLLLAGRSLASSPSITIDRSLREQIIAQLFEIVEAKEKNYRSQRQAVEILTSLGGSAVERRFVELVESASDPNLRVVAANALFQMGYSQRVQLCYKLWKTQGHWDLTTHFFRGLDRSEAEDMISRIRWQVADGKINSLWDLKRLSSPDGQALLAEVLSNETEPFALRLASAAALAERSPRARKVLVGAWGDKKLIEVWDRVSIPQSVLSTVIECTDFRSVPVKLLESIWLSVRDYKGDRRQIAELLRRQIGPHWPKWSPQRRRLVLDILVRTRDEWVREFLHSEVAYPKRATDALALIAAEWPEDVLRLGKDLLIGEDILKALLEVNRPTDAHRFLLEHWWQEGPRRSGGPMASHIIRTLAEWGSLVAIEDYCEMLRSGEAFRQRIQASTLRTVTQYQPGRDLLRDGLSGRYGWRLDRLIIIGREATGLDDELAALVLSRLLRALPSRRNTFGLHWALEALARRLDQFVYFDQDGYLHSCPRSEATWMPVSNDSTQFAAGLATPLS